MSFIKKIIASGIGILLLSVFICNTSFAWKNNPYLKSPKDALHPNDYKILNTLYTKYGLELDKWNVAIDIEPFVFNTIDGYRIDNSYDNKYYVTDAVVPCYKSPSRITVDKDGHVIYLHLLSKIKDVSNLPHLKVLCFSKPNAAMPSIHDLPQLEEIYITHKKNKYTNLYNLPKLRVLEFDDTRISNFEQTASLPSLEVLNLIRDNYIRTIDLSKFPNLRKLKYQYHYNDHKLSDLNATNTPYLEHLNVEGHEIKEIKGLGQLKHITYLNVNDSPLLNYQEIKQLKQLKTLEIDDAFNHKRNDYQFVSHLTTLTNLYLGGYDFQNLYFLKKLKDLKKLTLVGNIQNSTGLSNLPNLVDLRISSSNGAKILPMTGMPKLEKLDLSRSNLSSIKGLLPLTNLRELNLKQTNIPRIEGLDNMAKLKVLNLGWCDLKRIEGLQGLKSLRELYLERNQITKLEGLKGLTNLGLLHLYENQIEKIEGLDDLTNLEMLWIYDNPIKKIEGLDNLKSLNNLVMTGTEITIIENIEKLESLIDIKLDTEKVFAEPHSDDNRKALNAHFQRHPNAMTNYRKLAAEQEEESQRLFRIKNETEHAQLKAEYKAWVKRGKQIRAKK